MIGTRNDNKSGRHGPSTVPNSLAPELNRTFEALEPEGLGWPIEVSIQLDSPLDKSATWQSLEMLRASERMANHPTRGRSDAGSVYVWANVSCPR